jgi:hypothetical protein
VSSVFDELSRCAFISKPAIDPFKLIFCRHLLPTNFFPRTSTQSPRRYGSAYYLRRLKLINYLGYPIPVTHHQRNRGRGKRAFGFGIVGHQAKGIKGRGLDVSIGEC